MVNVDLLGLFLGFQDLMDDLLNIKNMKRGLLCHVCLSISNIRYRPQSCRWYSLRPSLSTSDIILT